MKNNKMEQMLKKYNAAQLPRTTIPYLEVEKFLKSLPSNSVDGMITDQDTGETALIYKDKVVILSAKPKAPYLNN